MIPGRRPGVTGTKRARRHYEGSVQFLRDFKRRFPLCRPEVNIQTTSAISLSVVSHGRHPAVFVFVKVPGVLPCSALEATRAHLCFMGACRS